jgi:hypothetical protein
VSVEEDEELLPPRRSCTAMALPPRSSTNGCETKYASRRRPAGEARRRVTTPRREHPHDGAFALAYAELRTAERSTSSSTCGHECRGLQELRSTQRHETEHVERTATDEAENEDVDEKMA